jgi:hypothetical protein
VSEQPHAGDAGGGVLLVLGPPGSWVEALVFDLERDLAAVGPSSHDVSAAVDVQLPVLDSLLLDRGQALASDPGGEHRLGLQVHQPLSTAMRLVGQCGVKEVVAARSAAGGDWGVAPGYRAAQLAFGELAQRGRLADRQVHGLPGCAVHGPDLSALAVAESGEPRRARMACGHAQMVPRPPDNFWPVNRLLDPAHMT